MRGRKYRCLCSNVGSKSKRLKVKYRYLKYTVMKRVLLPTSAGFIIWGGHGGTNSAPVNHSYPPTFTSADTQPHRSMKTERDSTIIGIMIQYNPESQHQLFLRGSSVTGHGSHCGSVKASGPNYTDCHTVKILWHKTQYFIKNPCR